MGMQSESFVVLWYILKVYLITTMVSTRISFDMSKPFENKVVFGPMSSFYDESDGPEFQIFREEDGLFFEFRQFYPGLKKESEFVEGCTLVEPQIKKLIKVLEKELKRLQKK
ncbi:hypothetical protein F67_I3_11_027 [Rhizobium phage RHph_I3_11]|nr:hypothetical protein F67_I3_11_027 [Rhizobium phage RHph_I3_11]